jgi:hypothetical protein
MCAPLARVVLRVSTPLDPAASGVQIRPQTPARYVLPKHPRVRCWHSHTLIRTREHCVDALTGSSGCERSEYLRSFWHYPEALISIDVDVHTIDPGVQYAER